MKSAPLLLAVLAAGSTPGSARTEAPPIDVVEDSRPDALHAWHLYDHDGDSPTVGDRVTLVGQFDPASRSVLLRQPPWLMVSPAPGAEPSRARQIFSVGLADPPHGLDADGFMRVEATLVAADPDPDDGAPRYRLDGARVEPIRLARPVAALAADVAGAVRGAEARLRALCAEQGLRYDFDPEPTGMSWHDGRIAFTARLSAHPGFSFKPVPYATVSVLFKPTTGRVDRIIVTRRLWADPRD